MLVGAAFSAMFVIVLFASLPAFAYADTDNETYEVTVEGAYHQTEARSMLSLINAMRHNKGTEEWNQAWYYDENNVKVEAKDYGDLKWDYGFEKAAMQRAIELSLLYNHTRPTGETSDTACASWGYYTSDNLLITPMHGESIASGSRLNSATEALITLAEADEDYENQGHRRQLLGKYNAVGIACVQSNGCYFWALEYGDGTSESAFAANDTTESRSVKVDLKTVLSSSITPIENNFTLSPGETKTLPTSADFQIYNQALTRSVFSSAVTEPWTIKSSSDIVKLNGNTATGLKPGTATLISRALDGRETVCTVTVTGKTASIFGLPAQKTVRYEDGGFSLSASTDSGAQLEYRSSNDSVASVDANGNVTPKASGIAKITVVSPACGQYGEAKAEMELVVTKNGTASGTSSSESADGGQHQSQTIIIQNNSASTSQGSNVTVTPAKASAPAKTSISKLVKAKKSFTVKWKKKSGVTGYQIRYSLKSSMKGSKTVKVKSAKTTSKKVKKLKKKKKYYVQVRTYKVVNGKTYWSGWSDKKSVKTK